MAFDPTSRPASPRQVGPRNPDGSRGRTGLHLGPVRITPARVFLAIALIGSLAYTGYAVTVRDADQIPALASGAALLGIVFTALAITGVVATLRAAREGAAGRSVLYAVLGGVAALVAFGCFAGAAILAILARPA